MLLNGRRRTSVQIEFRRARDGELRNQPCGERGQDEDGENSTTSSRMQCKQSNKKETLKVAKAQISVISQTISLKRVQGFVSWLTMPNSELETTFRQSVNG
jgi:hypothetical protein